MSKFWILSSKKNKLCIATLHEIFNFLALAFLINSTDLADDIVGICKLPSVYSKIDKSLAILISSAIDGMPFNPSDVLIKPSFITPSCAISSS